MILQMKNLSDVARERLVPLTFEIRNVRNRSGNSKFFTDGVPAIHWLCVLYGSMLVFGLS